jgi:hypothetical protein
MEEIRPPVVVAGGRQGRIGALLGTEAHALGSDRVPLALRAWRRRRDTDPVDGHPPSAPAWQAHVRRDMVARVVQRAHLRHLEAAASEAVRGKHVLAGRRHCRIRNVRGRIKSC